MARARVAGKLSPWPDAQDGDPARHARIEQLFHAATELPPDTRTEWLQAQCGGDEALRSRVEAMLAADAEGTSSSIAASRSRPVR